MKCPQCESEMRLRDERWWWCDNCDQPIIPVGHEEKVGGEKDVH